MLQLASLTLRTAIACRFPRGPLRVALALASGLERLGAALLLGPRRNADRSVCNRD
ncbi:hypothetical protein JQ557_30110 [Bradyrhizobium sp. U87765 SZCCT0131]|uniref:hypothetical protein n=1 Tax=unclassified Bradyrhizobium TaxID=2631580 RepID=UPI001BAC55F7|nr:MULTISPECIES: hypothetical protein [unclassified Bradyrhizobium]MBR1222289.1 hypothetical protein [Bradyrhizobium sp. U87765 SZCCT0131]MBR1264227.1 hypothetical protein [Bradyrhizobium sp. U87765 SZCCT0134]MBR1307990.1 hypothetical protein [Bradyrhizobium sp. U87765 SZCCT0110]MBR1320477.1 hypothetical protein [Bradyrhizobium sp. U87765 SZCCT0109]MBR1348410.1 hypothetical protein [Bradyrhizobium sp. U87765 SZCCT0048]